MKLQELQSTLSKCIEAIKGQMDPSEYKNYIFPLLFWKHISEVPTFPLTLKWGNAEILSIKDIAVIFSTIHEVIPNLNNIFDISIWNNEYKLPNEKLLNLLNILNNVDLTNTKSDVLGQAYEYLILENEPGRKLGEYFTPRSVVKLVAELLDPKPGDSIYDPACGSGGMLIGAINHLKENKGSLHISGSEINYTTAALARMNLYFHNVKHDIKLCDTLNSPADDNKYDIILANPPFSMKDWGNWNEDDPRILGAVAPKKCGDFAWIQHIIYSMKEETGRAAVIMPLGVLFRSGAEQKIRQAILEEEDILESLILLKDNIFYSTNIQTCIFIFNKNKPPERENHVLFIDATKAFVKEEKSKKYTLDDKGIKDIVDTYKLGQRRDNVFCSLVHLPDIINNKYDLNITRYVNYNNEEEVLPFHEAFRNWEKLTYDINNHIQKMHDFYKEYGLIDKNGKVVGEEGFEVNNK